MTQRGFRSKQFKDLFQSRPAPSPAAWRQDTPFSVVCSNPIISKGKDIDWTKQNRAISRAKNRLRKTTELAKKRVEVKIRVGCVMADEMQERTTRKLQECPLPISDARYNTVPRVMLERVETNPHTLSPTPKHPAETITSSTMSDNPLKLIIPYTSIRRDYPGRAYKRIVFQESSDERVSSEMDSEQEYEILRKPRVKRGRGNMIFSSDSDSEDPPMPVPKSMVTLESQQEKQDIIVVDLEEEEQAKMEENVEFEQADSPMSLNPSESMLSPERDLPEETKPLPDLGPLPELEVGPDQNIATGFDNSLGHDHLPGSDNLQERVPAIPPVVLEYVPTPILNNNIVLLNQMVQVVHGDGTTVLSGKAKELRDALFNMGYDDKALEWLSKIPHKVIKRLYYSQGSSQHERGRGGPRGGPQPRGRGIHYSSQEPWYPSYRGAASRGPGAFRGHPYQGSAPYGRY